MTNTRGHQTCAQVLEVMAWFVLEIVAQQLPHTVPVSEDGRSPSSSDVGPPISRTMDGCWPLLPVKSLVHFHP